MNNSVRRPILSQRSWINTILYLSTTVASALLGLVSAILMTHLLTPNQYGRIGVVLSVLFIAVPMVSLAAEGLIAVNRSTLDIKQYERFRRTIMGVGLVIFMLLQTVGFALWVANILQEALLLVVPAFALIRLTTTMATTEYIVEEKAVTYSALILLNSLTALVLTYVFMSWVSASADARLAALMAAELVILLIRYRGRMTLLFQPIFEPKYLREIFRFGLPSLFSLFGAWALNESDKVVVAYFAGLEIAGVYSAASALAIVMASFNQALSNALFPGLFKRLLSQSEHIQRLVIEYVIKFSAINLVFALFLMGGFGLVKDILLPSKYAAAAPYFYSLTVANLAVAIFRPLSLVTEFFKMAIPRACAITVGGTSTIACAAAGLYMTNNPLWAALGIASGYLVAAAILVLSLYKLNPYGSQ